MTKKKSDSVDPKNTSKPTPKAKPSTTANDPWYGKVVAKSGKVVSGGAGLLVRTQAMGGMNNIVHNVATAAVQEATKAATKAYVTNQTGDIIEMPNARRKKK